MNRNPLSDIHVLTSSVNEKQTLLFENPREIITVHGADDLEKAFEALERATNAGLWAAGYLAYEFGYLLEERFHERQHKTPEIPLLWFGFFDEPSRLTHNQVDQWLVAKGQTYSVIAPPQPTVSRAEYSKRFTTTKQKIEAGDIYQLNLTFKSKFQIEGDPLALYHGLRQKQPVAHGAFINTGEFSVLSISPELFLKRYNDTIETRPMKGTEPRAASPEADEQARLRLRNDEKQRAENLMIVDLMRNDIARVSKVGSVTVPDLFTVETYPTLHQLTSTVKGKLAPDTSMKNLIKALFPAGSITGAPKIRAMELISDLEYEPRGVYCGSIGYVAPDRTMNMNVAIRTLTISTTGHGEMGIGSGIVADSDVIKEYDEALLKMKFLKDTLMDFQLFETMLFTRDSGFWLFDEHMKRLAHSAEKLGFPFSHSAALNCLDEHIKGTDGERLRVRLVLESGGGLSVTSAILPARTPDTPAAIKFVISKSRMDSQDIFLKHKTTNRALYDEEFGHYQKLHNSGEVIYLNEKSQLTEGSRTNIFLRIDGKLLTPALECGLLPGTLRAHLLTTGEAKEAVLTPSSLQEAEQVYLGNSVRGLQPATLVGQGS